jgi:hypothetical protein
VAGSGDDPVTVGGAGAVGTAAGALAAGALAAGGLAAGAGEEAGLGLAACVGAPLRAGDTFDPCDPDSPPCSVLGNDTVGADTEGCVEEPEPDSPEPEFAPDPDGWA